MPESVLAATTIGAFKTAIREYPFPEISPESGILKVEAAGVCGSDWQAYQQDFAPHIMGHENVGRIYNRIKRGPPPWRATVRNHSGKPGAGIMGRLPPIPVSTSGFGADAPATLTTAIKLAGKNGTVLFVAAPTLTPPEFQVSDLLARRLTLKPCRGHSYESVELALRYIASGRFPLHLLATNRFGLPDVDLALRSVGGQGAPGAVEVAVLPWL